MTKQQLQTREESIDFLVNHKLVVPNTTIYAISRLYTGKTRYVSFLLLRPRDITESIPYSTPVIRPFYLTNYIADILPTRLYEKRGYMCISSRYSGDIAQEITHKLSYRLFNNEYKLQTVWL